MKRLFFVLTLVTLASVWASAQPIEDLLKDNIGRVAGAVISSQQARDEQKKLSKQAAIWNAKQLPVTLKKVTVEIGWPHDYQTWNGSQQGWFRTEIKHLFTQKDVEAFPVWDIDEIDQQTAKRQRFRNNDEGDQSTAPDKGTISFPRLVVSVDYKMFEKTSDLDAFWDRLFRSVGISFSSETTYLGLLVTVTDNHSGKDLAVYKTLGRAGSNDNLGGGISDFFGSSVGFRSQSDSEDDRNWRALQSALEEMSIVLHDKAR